MSTLRVLGVQLTVRCDMRCAHCFVDLGRGDMPLAWVREIASFAVSQGCARVSLTGGEPTLHREFDRVLAIVAEHDLRFSLVSNAWGFTRYFPRIRKHRDRLEILDFSLDGATPETHDENRRAGSFERVLEAARICRREGVRFGFRFTATRRNWNEIESVVDLAESCGADYTALIPMQPSAHDAPGDLLPSPTQLLGLAAGVGRLRKGRRTRVELTTGHFNLDLYQPCPTLAEQSIYVTARGDLSLCCQLGGYPSNGTEADVVGNMREMSIADAWDRVREQARRIKQLKAEMLDEHRLTALDYFPCWFCVKHMGKVDWMRRSGGNPWATDLAETTTRSRRLLQVG